MNLHLAAEPATRPASHRTRRLVVRGGSALPLRLSPGDRVTITDPEGLQAAHLAVFSAEGPGTIALDPSIPWDRRPLATLLAEAAETATARAFCTAERIDPAAEIAVATLFDGTGAAGGASTSRRPRTRASSWSPRASPWRRKRRRRRRTSASRSKQWSPSAARLRRRSRRRSSTSASPPRPATAYRVAAGDYIQIIDVDGKQCSDFPRLRCRGARGRRGIRPRPDDDAHPGRHRDAGPGLHAKYFDARMRPLVEVVQDTVGRHDTFMLACTAKYTKTSAIPATPTARTISIRRWSRSAIAARKAGRRSTSSTTPPSMPTAPSSQTSRGRGPGLCAGARALTDLVCARRPAPTTSTRERLGADRHPPARLRQELQFSQRDRPPHDARRRTEDDARIRLPPAHGGAVALVRRDERLLAAALLRDLRSDLRNIGPAASAPRSWTSRPCASTR